MYGHDTVTLTLVIDRAFVSTLVSLSTSSLVDRYVTCEVWLGNEQSRALPKADPSSTTIISNAPQQFSYDSACVKRMILIMVTKFDCLGLKFD